MGVLLHQETNKTGSGTLFRSQAGEAGGGAFFPFFRTLKRHLPPVLIFVFRVVLVEKEREVDSIPKNRQNLPLNVYFCNKPNF